jgi:hypothetical protein
LGALGYAYEQEAARRLSAGSALSSCRRWSKEL